MAADFKAAGQDGLASGGALATRKSDVRANWGATHRASVGSRRTRRVLEKASRAVCARVSNLVSLLGFTAERVLREDDAMSSRKGWAVRWHRNAVIELSCKFPEKFRRVTLVPCVEKPSHFRFHQLPLHTFVFGHVFVSNAN